ncbi:ATP synthase subunit s, mitochondrial [Phlebotomus papatasi]|uniref:ATP synthase subunit s, mitochondrial n=1 Tax=Phlebotomus papatasi TaxID=29031 RepID=UPI0024843794|nr:ATP synthase subunit s, mitochondrial [Phlebotomus papatasi]
MFCTKVVHPALRGNQISGRNLFYWVNIIFNTVDKRRLRKVGPDRLCAEWVLKNGGAVRFCESPNNLLDNYNLLPPEDTSKVTLKEINATNSAIMTIGFAHLEGCSKIDKIIIENCKFVDNRGFHHLAKANESLKHLEIGQCANVSDSGLLELKNLSKLQKLVLKDLPGVKDWPGLEAQLKTHLKDCQLQFKPT